MYSRILDSKTYADVVSRAPRLRSDPEENARQVLRFIVHAIRLRSLLLREETIEGHAYWSVLVGQMSAQILSLTPREVGHAFRDLGLNGERTRDGYRYYWNKNQLDILCAALEVEHV